MEPVPEPQPLAESEPVKILITRHSFSCNQATSMKANDPALTRNGIDMAMKRAKYEVFNEGFDEGERLYDSNVVLVSCLLRTWQTALLLYNPDISGDVDHAAAAISEAQGPTNEGVDLGRMAFSVPRGGGGNSRRTNFTLYVYPYLKEHIKVVGLIGIKRGNYPTELKLTLANFLKFLEFIRVNYSDYYINSLPSQININIWNDEGRPLTFLLTRTTNNSHFVVEINEEDCHRCIRQSDSEIINQFFDGSKFVEEGNLNTFVSHIDDLSPPDQKKLGPNGTIHVVAHSSLMRTYLKRRSIVGKISSINDEQGIGTMRDSWRIWSYGIDDKVINNISETNMFSFEMELSGNRATLYKVYLGLSIPDPPPTERNRDLCDMGEFWGPGLAPVLNREPEHDIYRLGDKVKIKGTNTGEDGLEGIIIGYYINGNLNDGDSGEENLGLDDTKFERLRERGHDVIRVEYSSIVANEEFIHRKLFSKDKIHNLSLGNSETSRNSVTLTLAGGGRLKKSKRKNKKTTKRKKNKKKSKRRKYKRRKNTRRK